MILAPGNDLWAVTGLTSKVPSHGFVNWRLRVSSKDCGIMGLWTCGKLRKNCKKLQW